MSFNNRNQRLNGFNPLAYMGDNAYQPPEFVTDNRAPTVNDSQNFELGTIWLNVGAHTPPDATDIWMLVSLDGGIATWVQMSGGTGDVKTLTGNSGGAVSPDGLGNINVLGDGTTLNIAGNPGTNTLTASVAQVFAATYTTDDANFAVPVAYNLNIFGAGGITTSSAGNTVTITGPSGTMTGLRGDNLNVATPTAGVIDVAGGFNITTAATAGPNTLAISVSGTTNHALQIGNATGSLTSLGVAANGQLPIGSAGADPVLATLTAGSGISIANAAGSITISSTAFSPTYFQATFNTENNITGDGTIAQLGATAAATTVVNVGSAFNPGNGAGVGASFTAPATGFYAFHLFTDFSVGASATNGVDFSVGLGGAAGLNFGKLPTKNFCANFANNSGEINVGGSGCVQLNASDVVTFVVQSNGAGKNLSINVGWVSGFRIA